jgi:hypothetical protein
MVEDKPDSEQLTGTWMSTMVRKSLTDVHSQDHPFRRRVFIGKPSKCKSESEIFIKVV